MNSVNIWFFFLFLPPAFFRKCRRDGNTRQQWKRQKNRSEMTTVAVLESRWSRGRNVVFERRCIKKEVGEDRNDLVVFGRLRLADRQVHSVTCSVLFLPSIISSPRKKKKQKTKCYSSDDYTRIYSTYVSRCSGYNFFFLKI